MAYILIFGHITEGPISGQNGTGGNFTDFLFTAAVPHCVREVQKAFPIEDVQLENIKGLYVVLSLELDLMNRWEIICFYLSCVFNRKREEQALFESLSVI